MPSHFAAAPAPVEGPVDGASSPAVAAPPIEPRPAPRGLQRGVVAAVLAALGAQLVLLWRFTADDAMIVARYAGNLNRVGRLEFNPHEPVNALTSILHALLLAAIWPVVEGELAAKLLGVAALAVALGLVWRGLRDQPMGRLLALVLVATSPYVVLWTVGGLETPIVLALVIAVGIVARRERPAGVGDLVGLGLLGGLTVLGRFDLALLVGPAILAVVWRSRASWGRRIGALVPGAAIVAAWLAYAEHTFGDVLPTSAHAKAPDLTMQLFSVGLIYEVQLALFSGMALVAVWAWLRIRRGPFGQETLAAHVRRFGAIEAGIVVYLLYGTEAGTVHMMFSYRLFVPVIGLGALAIADLVQRATEVPSRHTVRPVALLVAVIIVANLGQAWWVQHRSLNPGIVNEYTHESAQAYVEQFLPAMRRQALALHRDWAAHGLARAPRVDTYAAGFVPALAPEAYTFEVLVSWRAHCHFVPRELAALADYAMVMNPRVGKLEDNLGTQWRGRWVLVSSEPITFDGHTETLGLYRNLRPEANTLPATIGGACPTLPPMP